MQKIVLPNNVLLPEVEKLLSQGIEVTMKVKGNSMLPFIVGDSDRVILHKTPQLNRGDIVLAYLSNNSYVLHRIIKIASDNVTLMGDGNIYGVEHCKRRDVSGKVIKIVRDGNSIDVDSKMERFKSSLWFLLQPVRRYLLWIYRKGVK